MSEKRLRLSIAAGRLALASLFVLGGINKVMNYESTLEAMAHAGLPMPGLLLPMVIFLEFAGGLVVAIGRSYTVVVACALALFTLATNLVFHDFWNFSNPRAALELSLFFKNISIAGALVFLAGVTARSRAT